MYLKISLSDFLTLFSARSRTWMWDKMPGKLLIFAFVFAVGISTALSATWPLGEGAEKVKGQHILFVWVFSLVFLMIQDMVKVRPMSFRILRFIVGWVSQCVFC